MSTRGLLGLLICVVIGYLIAGGIGAIIGLVIGLALIVGGV